jgi:O-antigen/teichoic acid export membrane protein
MPVRSLTVAVGQYVAIPAMCLVQRDLRRMASWYLATVRAFAATTAPLALCLVALPDLLVFGICGSQWAAAVPLVRLLGPTVFLLPLLYTRPVYVATGRVDLLLKVSLLQLILATPAVYLAARVSLEAVCAVQVGVFGAVAAVNITFIRQLLHLGWGEIARALRVPLEGVAVQGLVLLGLRAWLRPEPTVWAFGAMATPALVAYAVVMRLRQPELVGVLLGAAKRASGPPVAG